MFGSASLARLRIKNENTSNYLQKLTMATLCGRGDTRAVVGARDIRIALNTTTLA